MSESVLKAKSWTELYELAEASGHRVGVVLSGNRDWCIAQAEAAYHHLNCAPSLWVSGEPPDGVASVTVKQAGRWLGQETGLLVFDGFSGFNPDAFGALCGTIRGGGLLILLVPPLDSWPEYIDPASEAIAVFPYNPEQLPRRFIARLVAVIRGSHQLYLVEQEATSTGVYAISGDGDAPFPRAGGKGSAIIATGDQALAVEAVIKVAKGHRRRPAVLISDRGRGKSSALGLAAGRLLKAGLNRIIVTAPRIDSVAAVFEHAAGSLENRQQGKLQVQYNNAVLEFIPPDELIRSNTHCDLVLVDEAAAIPAPLLETLLIRYSRIVFASTVHGYEGTGRGFDIRFKKVLDQRTPQWKRVRLEEPVRWATGDPLEAFVFDALMLGATPVTDDLAQQVIVDQCAVEKVDRDQLLDDKVTLSELFGLLVLAHYRTTPADLRYLLDGPNLDVWIMRFRNHVVGACLVAYEGGFDETLAESIWRAERRPRGHMIPQSLAVHSGFKTAPTLSCARIVRIAVHPRAQGLGAGTCMLNKVIACCKGQGLDYVGSSFGATEEVLGFWRKSGLLPVRLGVTREASSGTHSAMVMRPLSAAGERLAGEARARFVEQFPNLLLDVFKYLEPELVRVLLAECDGEKVWLLNPQDRLDLQAFARGYRIYEASTVPIWKLVLRVLTQTDDRGLLDKADTGLLIAKILQKREWADIAAIYGLSGKKVVVNELRRVTGKMLPYA